MEAGKVQEACALISRWYIPVRGVHAPPTTEALGDVAVDTEELYRCRPPEVLRVPLLVRQGGIEDGIQTEAEVSEAVMGLKGGR